jgi:two-component system, NarL family, response regulator NreC
MTTQAIRVLLADDHETVRQGLRLLLDAQQDMEVVGEAGDGHAALLKAESLHPDVVVLDISMPEMNGLAATRAIREASPQSAIVALTRHGDDAYVQELLKAGARGYVLKQSTSAELLRAIRDAAAGKRYLDPTLVDKMQHAYVGRYAVADKAIVRVSDRESEVLRLMALGHSNKEIATTLGLSVKTVEVHKANAMRKLGLRGRIDVVRYAVLQGWLHES